MRRAHLLLALACAATGCTADRDVTIEGAIRITVVDVDGAPLPTEDAPLPTNLGDRVERWHFTAEALDAQGNPDPTFEGVARASIRPGSVDAIEGPDGLGRNLRFRDGKAEGTAVVAGMFGPSRLWLADIGYQPAEGDEDPACANGVDDDGDVQTDFPNDPGCAFADDESEDPGTLLTGVSPPIFYELPTVAEVQGRGSTTPFEAVAVDVAVVDPVVIVTRVASDGFYVTDISDPGGYNHLFAFNFNTPEGMRVCDRLQRFSGTATEFFGFTEVSFPSYEIGRVTEETSALCVRDDDCPETAFCAREAFSTEGRCQPCLVPEPVLLTNALLNSDAELEKLESGLVRVEQMRITPNFGPDFPEEVQPLAFKFDANASNCDLDEDGRVDFENAREGACSNQCGSSADCSEWTAYASRGNYKIARQTLVIQANTGTARGFDPVAHKGETIASLSGTLRNFSGGSLNWTIETRCGDDLVCNFDAACQSEPVPSTRACIAPATEGDNDAATN